MLPEIVSAANPRVKRAVKLRESRARRKDRHFLIDGAREILRALLSGVVIEEVYRDSAPRGAANESLDPLMTRLDQDRVSVWPVAPELFRKIAFGDRNESLIALAAEPDRSWRRLEEVLPECPLLAVLEGIEKPGNIGAVFRSADAAGIDAVLLADCGDDFFHPNTIRSSLGTVFSVPSVSAGAERIHSWLTSHNVSIISAICQESHPYTEYDYTGATAIVLGSEADGLTERWRYPPARGAILPMLGVADSLNISNAAAVFFYEARRQRDRKKPRDEARQKGGNAKKV